VGGLDPISDSRALFLSPTWSRHFTVGTEILIDNRCRPRATATNRMSALCSAVARRCIRTAPATTATVAAASESAEIKPEIDVGPTARAASRRLSYFRSKEDYNFRRRFGRAASLQSCRETVGRSASRAIGGKLLTPDEKTAYRLSASMSENK